MDEKDFGILGHLLSHPDASIEETSRTVGLTRNAAARRIRLMQTSPLRLRFWILPHFSLFRRQSHVFLFQTHSPFDPDKLLAVDPLLAYDDNHDGLLAATVWTPAGSPVKAPAPLETLAGGPPVVQFTDATPGPKHPYLSKLQWKVVRALLDAPRGSAADLARRTGLSPRTCARHRRSLLEGRYVQASVSIQEDRSGGFPVYRVYVQGRFDRAAVMKQLGAGAQVTDEVEEGTVFLGKATTTGDMIATVGRIRRMSGVDDVKLILSRGYGVALDRVHAWVREAEAPNQAI